MIPEVERPAGWYDAPEYFIPLGKCEHEKCLKCGGIELPHDAVSGDERHGYEDYECFGGEDDTECNCEIQ